MNGDLPTSVVAAPPPDPYEAKVNELAPFIQKRESGGDPRAVSKKGAIGLYQIMPSTAADYGVSQEALYHPEVNKMVYRRYMKDLLKRYNGNTQLALAAYNAGPGRVDRGHVPPETREYVSGVMADAKKALGSMSGVLGASPAYAEEVPTGAPTPSVRPRGWVNIDKLKQQPAWVNGTEDDRNQMLRLAQNRNHELSMRTASPDAGDPGALPAPPGPLTKAPTTILGGPPPSSGAPAATPPAAAPTTQPPWYSMEQGVFQPNPAYVKATQPLADIYASGLHGLKENLAFRPLRRLFTGGPLTTPPGESAQSWGRTLGPGENLTQGALNAYFTLAGPVEAAFKRGGMEAVPAGLRWMVPFIKSRGARVLAPALGSAALTKATGGSGTAGGVMGGVMGTAGELGQKAWDTVVGSMAESFMESRLGRKIAQVMLKGLPGIPADVSEKDLVRMGVKGEVEDKVRRATAMTRLKVLQEASQSGTRFDMPAIGKGMKIEGASLMSPLGSNPVKGTMNEAEEMLNRLGETSFTEKAVPKLTDLTRTLRRAQGALRDEIVNKLNRIPGTKGLGDLWDQQRTQNAMAHAFARLFNVRTGAIDLVTGRINQPKLITAILDRHNQADLIRAFGPEAYDRLYDAATRNSVGGIMDVLGERLHVGIRPPHGFHINLPAAPKLAGQTPIWLYPPTASFAIPAAPVGGAAGEAVEGFQQGMEQ